MDNLLEFLTSKEIIIVYMISGLACLMCFIIYLTEKNSQRLRKKHNTRELNKLVKKIKEKMPEEETKVVYEKPVLQNVSIEENSNSVDELLEKTINLNNTIKDEVSNSPVIIDVEDNIESIEKEESISIKEEMNDIENNIIEEQEKNILLNNYEEEQEKTAIISLDELIKKGKELYEANELSQYQDEGDEPISIQDLEKRTEKTISAVKEPFVIENVVPEHELKVDLEQAIKEQKEELIEKKFKSSPIISPIYGIETINNTNVNDLSLENTANYEKLDKDVFILMSIIKLNTKSITTYKVDYKTSKEVTTIENVSTEDAISYVDDFLDEIEDLSEKENITKEEKKEIENKLSKIKDFILKNGKINGKSYNDLSEKDKQKIMNYYLSIDEKLESKIPNYKEKLKVYSKKEYNKMKKKAKKEINNYIETAGEEKIKEQKKKSNRILNNIKKKIKNWLNNKQ